MIFGYSLAFTPGSTFIGSADRFFLHGMTPDDIHPMAPTIPEALFCLYHMTFAIITPALITGAPAERLKFSSMLIFSALWSILVYSPVAHWCWHPEGFLFKAEVLDFAGGDVVHVNSGAAALVASIMLGKRTGHHFPPHNITISLTGACFLWVGWFGFNAGSALGANKIAGFALANSHIASAAGGMAWMCTEWIVSGKPTVLSIISGSVAGLVGITPGCGFVDFTGAFVIGITTAVVCFYSVRIKEKLGFDDALDAFGMHGVGGIYGGIVTGLFASPKIDHRFKGAFYGHGMQVAKQLYGIVVVFAYSAVVTYILLKILKHTIGLRVHKEHEEEGLDKSVHGEKIFFGSIEPVRTAGPENGFGVPVVDYRESQHGKAEANKVDGDSKVHPVDIET